MEDRGGEDRAWRRKGEGGGDREQRGQDVWKGCRMTEEDEEDRAEEDEVFSAEGCEGLRTLGGF